MKISKSSLDTCFVETHDWEPETGLSILIEYFQYESGVHRLSDSSKIQNEIHHTILSLQIF